MKNKKQSKIEAKKYESNAYEPNKTLSKENKDMSMNNIVGLAWGAKEILRDDFKKTEWSKNILPFLVLRRLGRVLEPTKNKVILEYEKIYNNNWRRILV